MSRFKIVYRGSAPSDYLEIEAHRMEVHPDWIDFFRGELSQAAERAAASDEEIHVLRVPRDPVDYVEKIEVNAP